MFLCLFVISMRNYSWISAFWVVGLVNGCGRVPVTLTLHDVLHAGAVAEALFGKQGPSWWLLWWCIFVFPYWYFVSFLPQEKHSIFIYFLWKQGFDRHFQFFQPPRMFCLFEWWLWATKSQSEELCFLVLNISSDLCDTWLWDIYVNYSDIWFFFFFFTAKSYFLWDK